MKSLSLDITTDFLLGTSTDSLGRHLPRTSQSEESDLHEKFGQAFDDISATLAKRVRM